MFLHNFKYNLKLAMRDKVQLLWSLVFIIGLGTLFWVTFGDIYDQDEKFKNIKTAVYIDDEEVKANFDAFIADVSLDEGGEKLLDITYVDSMSEAEKLVEEKKVEGAFYTEANSKGQNELKLLIGDDDIAQSILTSVAGKYHQIITVMSKIDVDDKAEMTKVLTALIAPGNENTEIKNSNSDMDVYTQYFYNLIALTCMMSISSAITVTVRNQGNTSRIGARKTVAGVSYIGTSLSGLIATSIIQVVCILIAMVYLTVIGVKFGNQYGKMAAIIVVSVFAGSSIGFLIGSIGKISANAKDGIGTAISVGGSFLSGLMIANMRTILQEKCPLVNKINPVALSADSFYAINTFDNSDRLIKNLASLMLIAVICIVIGNFIGRRKSYASI